jgi:hypothetical protein
VQYALKYIAACWDEQFVGNVLGSAHQRRRPTPGSTVENVSLLTILLPDASEAPKPALSSISTIKHALAVLTSLVQVRVACVCFQCFNSFRNLEE